MKTLFTSTLLFLTLFASAQIKPIEPTPQSIDLKLDAYRRDRITSNVLILTGLTVMAASYYATVTDQAQTPVGLVVGSGLVASGLVVNLTSLRHFKASTLEAAR